MSENQNEASDELFLGVMELQEAKTHQIKLKSQNIIVDFKTHQETCTSGCKVTVEVWGKTEDKEKLLQYFHHDFKKNLGHEINQEALNSIFDPSSSEVICQACGAKFSPTSNECPDCGLMY